MSVNVSIFVCGVCVRLASADLSTLANDVDPALLLFFLTTLPQTTLKIEATPGISMETSRQQPSICEMTTADLGCHSRHANYLRVVGCGGGDTEGGGGEGRGGASNVTSFFLNAATFVQNGRVSRGIVRRQHCAALHFAEQCAHQAPGTFR